MCVDDAGEADGVASRTRRNVVRVLMMISATLVHLSSRAKAAMLHDGRLFRGGSDDPMRNYRHRRWVFMTRVGTMYAFFAASMTPVGVGVCFKCIIDLAGWVGRCLIQVSSAFPRL